MCDGNKPSHFEQLPSLGRDEVPVPRAYPRGARRRCLDPTVWGLEGGSLRDNSRNKCWDSVQAPFSKSDWSLFLMILPNAFEFIRFMTENLDFLFLVVNWDFKLWENFSLLSNYFRAENLRISLLFSRLNWKSKKLKNLFFQSLAVLSFQLTFHLWRGNFWITLEATIKSIGDFRFEFVFSVWLVLVLLLLPNKNITNIVFVFPKHKINRRFANYFDAEKSVQIWLPQWWFFPWFSRKKLELCQQTIRERERERIELQLRHNFKDIF